MRSVCSVPTARGIVSIIHDAEPADIDASPISDGLRSIIRTSALRHRFYRQLAANPDARLTIAVADGIIVGRAVVGESFGRWQHLPRVREFAIEVAREWRRTGLGTRLTEVALHDPAAEDEIIIAFTLPAAWDAEHEGLPLPVYGRMLLDSADRHGFRRVSTDEPEIRLRDAAMIVRPGSRVPAEALARFEAARYIRRQPALTVAA